MSDDKGHHWIGVVQPGTVHGPEEHHCVCRDCGIEAPGSSDEIPTCDEMAGETLLSRWFGLSYAQFLTVPRLVMEAMPPAWQARMAKLLDELDGTFDWRPKEGAYWVRLRDDKGRFSDPDLCDYRRGSAEHLRRKPLAPIPPYES